MFEFFRSHRRLFQLLLLLLILPSFAFLGIEQWIRSSDADQTVAKVGDRAITQPELDQALRRSAEQMQAMLGGQFDPKMFDTYEARKGTLDGLIAEQLIRQHNQASRVFVTDERVRQQIASRAEFQRDGRFNLEVYRAFLQGRGVSSEAFEYSVRQDLAPNILPNTIGRTEISSGALAARLGRLSLQQRTIETLTFKPADFLAQVKIEPSEVEAFYKANSALFTEPERVDVEYVVLDRKSVGAQLTVPEDELRAFYTQNVQRFTVAEQRRARHILISPKPGDATPEAKAQAKTRAEEVLAAVKAKPAEFAAVAKQSSSDTGSAAMGGDLGFFEQGMMVKPFSDAVFAMKTGEISDLVETQYGFHIIKLEDIKAGSVKAFEAARAEILEEAKAQSAAKRFAEMAETFTNLVYEQSESYEEVAKRFNLTVSTAKGIAKNGSGVTDPLLRTPNVLQAIFASDSIAEKRNTAAIESTGGVLVSARVVNHQPSAVKPLSAVEDEVKGRLTVEKAQALAKTRGEEILATLKSGGPESQEWVKKLSGKAVVTPGKGEGLRPADLVAIFKAKPAPLPAWVGVARGSEGYAIFRLSAVDTPAEDSGEVKTATERERGNLRGDTAQRAVEAYLIDLRQRGSVTVNEKRLRSATSNPAEAG